MHRSGLEELEFSNTVALYCSKWGFLFQLVILLEGKPWWEIAYLWLHKEGIHGKFFLSHCLMIVPSHVTATVKG